MWMQLRDLGCTQRKQEKNWILHDQSVCDRQGLCSQIENVIDKFLSLSVKYFRSLHGPLRITLVDYRPKSCGYKLATEVTLLEQYIYYPFSFSMGDLPFYF